MQISTAWRLRPAWQDVQPGNATVYDWGSLDTIFGLASRYNKTIGISVAAGVNTPPGVYGAGAVKYALHDGSGLSMPPPWDAVFLAKWKAFIHAMGDRYDSNPKLGYVVISGLGQNVETYLSKSSVDDDLLTSMGGMLVWINAAKEIIAAYADAFPTTPFFITATKPLTTSDGLSALQQVIDWCVATYPGRFGIMNASLNAQSTTIYYPNLAINTYHAIQPTGLQMLCSASLDPGRLLGTLDQVLTQGALLAPNLSKYINPTRTQPATRQSWQIKESPWRPTPASRPPDRR